MHFSLTTSRLILQPFSHAFLKDYYSEFTEKITRYQYPDSFPDMETANQMVSDFVREMDQGNMLELVILSREGEFLGSLEVFGLQEETPEIGLWLKSSAHGAGYGYEALKGMLDFLSTTGKYKSYVYEVDVRNTPSIRLVEKFRFQKGGCEEVITETGKKLILQTYHIFH